MEYPFQERLNFHAEKSAQYYQYVNLPLINGILRPPIRIIEVGCARGYLGVLLKKRFPGVHITGIEPNLASAEFASQYLDLVFANTFENIDHIKEGISPHSYDTAILSDVIEHVYNPWEMLVQLKNWLTDDAQILLSIPNVQNVQILDSLFQNGQWTYQKQGLMDVTHIRFFTRKSIVQLMRETGYYIEKITPIIDNRFTSIYEQSKQYETLDISFDKISLKDLTQQEVTDLCTWQYLVYACLK
jgi:2-polyprenyl-3-methyl-5-hydroxy-6-metoxy-1,4-benzoquinol methylase